MAKFIWKESYNLGIEEIDTQHKKIIDIINEIYDAMSSGTSRFFVIDEIEKLFEYADNHFSREEELFVATDYPYVKAHREEHQFYINKVIKLKEDISKGDLLTLLKTVDFLKDWIIDHILGTDKGYTKYLSSKDNN